MASAEIPNPAPDVTSPDAAGADAVPPPADAPASADAPAPDLSSSPPLPPRKRRLSPSPSPTRSSSRSRSPRRSRSRNRSRSRSRSRNRSRSRSRNRSRSRSRSPQYPHDGKRRRHNDLIVEVCRNYLRDRCTRSDMECRYAHPHQSVTVDQDNKVTACGDSLRNNCFRGRTCRYYHPPPHIQESLLKSIGVEDPNVKMVCRDFARGKCSRSANECRYLHHSSVEDCAIVCQDFLRGRCERKSCRYSHAAAHPMPPMGNIPIQYPDMLYMPPLPPPPFGVPMMGPPPSPRAFADFRNSVEVCRDFLKNMCNRESCRFLHPDTHTPEMSDKVEICRDFKRGECNRPACRFYHPFAG